jgi:hypothetical protein
MDMSLHKRVTSKKAYPAIRQTADGRIVFLGYDVRLSGRLPARIYISTGMG